MKKQVRAIIFDFDGVIVDSEKQKFLQLNELLEKEGLHLEETEFSSIVGKKTELILREKFGSKLSESQILLFVKQRKDSLKSDLSNYGTPINDTIAEIRVLSKKYLLGIATGTDKEIVHALLDQLSIRHLFKTIISGNEVFESKPHPEIYFRALKQLNALPENTVVVEDSPAGILAAKRAGIQKIVALTTTQPKSTLAEATQIVNSLSEVKNW